MNYLPRAVIARLMSRVFVFVALIAGCAGAATSATDTAGSGAAGQHITVAAAAPPNLPPFKDPKPPASAPPTGGTFVPQPTPGQEMLTGTPPISEVNKVDERNLGKDLPMSHSIKGEGISVPPGISMPGSDAPVPEAEVKQAVKKGAVSMSGCVAGSEKGIACSKDEVKQADERSLGKDVPFDHHIKEGTDGTSLPPGCSADNEKGVICK